MHACRSTLEDPTFTDVTPAVASITVSGSTLTFAQPTGTGTATWSIANSTINGASGFTNAAGQSLSVSNTTFNAPLVNQGTLVASGSSAFAGAFSNAAGATLRVAQFDGCCSTATLTVASGFTNQGLIELSNQFGVAYSAQLNVTAGTLVNAAGATIASLGGQTPGGTRTLGAMLNNQGTLTVAVPLTLNASSADHVNSGLIDMTAANLTITQSGTTPTFTNSGTITLAAGRTLSVSGGAITSDATGTISGGGTVALANLAANFNGTPPGVDALSAAGSTLNFAQAVNTATMSLSLVSSTVNGAAALTNAVGRLLILDASTLTMPLANEGTIYASGSSQINGGMTTTSTSVIRIGQINGATSLALLTFGNAFTNNGQIELTTAFAVAYNARLAVTTGQFVNSATGTVFSSGGLAPGGTREIVSPGGVNNQGVLRIVNGAAGRLTITAPFQTSGMIDIELGGGTIATQYDHLQIIGSATFGGALNVTLINAFTPGVGQTFTPITYSSVTGSFGNYFLPPSLVNPPTIGATSLTLTGQ